MIGSFLGASCLSFDDEDANVFCAGRGSWSTLEPEAGVEREGSEERGARADVGNGKRILDDEKVEEASGFAIGVERGGFVIAYGSREVNGMSTGAEGYACCTISIASSLQQISRISPLEYLSDRNRRLRQG